MVYFPGRFLEPDGLSMLSLQQWITIIFGRNVGLCTSTYDASEDVEGAHIDCGFHVDMKRHVEFCML